MKLYDLCSSPERLTAMRDAIQNDASFPDWTALGSLAGPDIHQLMIHFNRDDEMRCILMNPEEVEFMGYIHNKVMDVPRYCPTPDELALIKALNLKLAMCGSKAN